jgi:hypothetical protein
LFVLKYFEAYTGEPRRRRVRVPTPANGQYVDERLEDLYRRHLLVGEGSVASYYDPELAAEAEAALLVPTESR